jgi:hypothetical protein
MTITKQVTNIIEAKSIINKLYNVDRSGGLQNKGLTFAGSVITATATKNKKGYEVVIHSNYYVKSSIESFIN